MIITCTAHGRTPTDARRLATHLSKARGQSVTVVASAGLTPAHSIIDALADLRGSLALSQRASIGFQHLTLNPAIPWPAAQRDEAVRRVLAELGANENAWILVEHADKARAAPGGSATHWHLIVAHVDLSGHALDMRDSFRRLEAVARTCEQDFGESLTLTRHARSVASHLMRMGRADIAAIVEANGTAPLPRSAMTSAGRQRSERLGLHLPTVRAKVRAAWGEPDFIAAIKLDGFRLALGQRRGVIILTTASGESAGALDRLAQVPRAEVLARVEVEMARRKKEGARNEQRNERFSDAGPARTRRLAGGGGDKINRRIDSGTSDAGRFTRPRFFDENRGQNGPDLGSPDAARRRRQRALIDLRRADSAARRRVKVGRRAADEVEATKLRLWAKVVGAEIAPEVAAALLYVDVAQRIARLIGGGWVRDQGDIIYASGADPRVVALVVASAQAKGWKAVRIWGPPDYIAEATRQFEAAGIPVTVGEEPPSSSKVRTPEPPSRTSYDDVVAYFERRQHVAQGKLNKLGQEPPRPDGFDEGLEGEEAAREARRIAHENIEEAREALVVAERDLAGASYFQQREVRLTRDDVAERVDLAKKAFRKADADYEEASARAVRLRKRRDLDLRRWDERIADAWKRELRERDFARECREAVELNPELAAVGIEAVERAVEVRLAAQERCDASEADEKSLRQP